MEREDPLGAPGPLDDERLAALFTRLEAPAPARDFVARTMNAVRRAPLPAGRRALRNPLASLLGWAAVIAGVAFLVLLVVLVNPLLAAGFTRLFALGVGTGVWLMGFARTAVAVLDVFATTSLAVARAASTTEGMTALTLLAVVCALSLAALHRLLISEGEDSQWQELS